MVILGLKLVHDRLQLAVFAHDERGAQDTVKLAAHKLFGAPRLFVCSGMVLIAQQLKIQFVALHKLCKLFDRVRADAQHDSI